MSKYRIRAAALLAAGAVAGGVTATSLAANADDTTGTASATGQTTDQATDQATGQDGRPGPGGPGGPGHGPGLDAAALAEALGVGEDQVRDALVAVRDQLAPDDATKPATGERPTPPTEAERTEREAALAKALAAELGLGEAKVSAALDEVRAAHEAERRQDLSDRLDQAVTDGDLTAGDRASVLKAYDAGVLGGPR
ncbi:hypothetical protein [Nocardioides daeguensis]|uniref:Uncharacterized protein n=1 Tax=Nocardioides daeguensis TaxID=908359 RepID=A0ABP6UXM7_9ACTN|nr:hypothetical protein [Nocardioides daeguensis]MBV6725936.1 hypothetical protein [Nocardioides daeguensis]MCR1772549.1 hypothetical protein [Nocardioides daeguensis]